MPLHWLTMGVAASSVVMGSCGSLKQRLTAFERKQPLGGPLDIRFDKYNVNYQITCLHSFHSCNLLNIDLGYSGIAKCFVTIMM